MELPSSHDFESDFSDDEVPPPPPPPKFQRNSSPLVPRGDENAAQEQQYEVKVMYDYDAQGDNDLTIREGDTVEVLIRHDESGSTSWWKVRVNGHEGYVPSNYLAEIPISGTGGYATGDSSNNNPFGLQEYEDHNVYDQVNKEQEQDPALCLRCTNCQVLIPFEQVESHSRVCSTGKKSSDADNITVKVRNPQKMGFISTMLTFELFVQTNIREYAKKDWTIRRTHDDFLKMHEMLSEQYFEYIVAPVPLKKKLFQDGSDRFTEKRLKGMQLFMNRMTAHRKLRVNPIFVAFLQASDADWKALQANYKPEPIRIMRPRIRPEPDDRLVKARQYLVVHERNLRGLFEKINETIKAIIAHSHEDQAHCAQMFHALADAEKKGGYLEQVLSTVAITTESLPEFTRTASRLEEDIMRYEIKEIIAYVRVAQMLLVRIEDTFDTQAFFKEQHALMKNRFVQQGANLAAIEQSDKAYLELKKYLDFWTVRADRMRAAMWSELVHFDKQKQVEFKELFSKYIEGKVNYHRQLMAKWHACMPAVKSDIDADRTAKENSKRKESMSQH
eukprot:Colp12_sorted_trinity150504_noHs@20800